MQRSRTDKPVECPRNCLYDSPAKPTDLETKWFLTRRPKRFQSWSDCLYVSCPK